MAWWRCMVPRMGLASLGEHQHGDSLRHMRHLVQTYIAQRKPRGVLPASLPRHAPHSVLASRPPLREFAGRPLAWRGFALAVRLRAVAPPAGSAAFTPALRRRPVDAARSRVTALSHRCAPGPPPCSRPRRLAWREGRGVGRMSGASPSDNLHTFCPAAPHPHTPAPGTPPPGLVTWRKPYRACGCLGTARIRVPALRGSSRRSTAPAPLDSRPRSAFSALPARPSSLPTATLLTLLPVPVVICSGDGGLRPERHGWSGSPFLPGGG